MDIVVFESEYINKVVVTANIKPIITEDFRFFLFNFSELESIIGDNINKTINAVKNLKKLSVNGFISLLINFTDIPIKPKRNPANTIGRNFFIIKLMQSDYISFTEKVL